MNKFEIIDEYGYKNYKILNKVLKRTLKVEKVKNAVFTVILVDEKKIKQAALAAMNGRPPLSTPLKMMMKLGRATRRRVDVDNLSKAIMDAVNGICYVDDCLVFSLYCTKYITDKPLVEVLIELIEE